MKAAAIIPAAGSGQRMGGMRKAFMQVGGKPLLQHSVEVFLSHHAITAVVVALSADDIARAPEWLRHARITLVEGGAERADSVRAGLHALDRDVDGIVVHDAARPLVTHDMIDRVLAEVGAGRSATVAIPVTDTLHEIGSEQAIIATPDRARYWRAQTPQAFPRDVLESAFAKDAKVSHATDEAGLVAALGWRVTLVPGDASNIKVTTPEDIALVESALLQRG